MDDANRLGIVVLLVTPTSNMNVHTAKWSNHLLVGLVVLLLISTVTRTCSVGCIGNHGSWPDPPRPPWSQSIHGLVADWIPNQQNRLGMQTSVNPMLGRCLKRLGSRVHLLSLSKTACSCVLVLVCLLCWFYVFPLLSLFGVHWCCCYQEVQSARGIHQEVAKRVLAGRHRQVDTKATAIYENTRNYAGT